MSLKQLERLSSLQLRHQEGFTLIELLVVVVIIGVLAAIALPSLLGQVNKAHQAEAKQNVGTMNRAQQAYYLENSAFATDLTLLAIGMQLRTANYAYRIHASRSLTEPCVQDIAEAIPGSLRSYYGLIGIDLSASQAPGTDATFSTMLCESTNPVQRVRNINSFPASGDCRGGFRVVGR